LNPDVFPFVPFIDQGFKSLNAVEPRLKDPDRLSRYFHLGANMIKENFMVLWAKKCGIA
jgi:hypothetical protein